MVNMSNHLLYQLDVINKQSLEVNYQMSTGKAIQTGSENSTLFNSIVNIESELSIYKGIENQINGTQLFNANSDSSVSQIKTHMEAINTEVLKALNGGISDTDKVSISKTIKSIEESIFNLTNESANSEYLFAGTATNNPPFEKDLNGKINYIGNIDYKETMVDKNSYKEQGINGIDLMFYTSDEAKTSSSLVFDENSRIIDSDGNEWKFIDHDNDGNIDNDRVYKNGDINSTLMPVTNNSLVPVEYTLVNTQNSTLEAKRNYFDDLNNMTNALELKDVSGNPINESDANKILSSSLEKINKAYDSINTSHASLGSKNSAFETQSIAISAKITNYQVFYEQTASADLTEAAVNAKSLEMTFSALYSTISRVNSLSLVNYM